MLFFVWKEHMGKTRKIFYLDKIIGSQTSITEIRDRLRSRLCDIYLSEENLAKLEAFGFGRSEILMAHSPKRFVSMSSVEVLQEFGFYPYFKKEVALSLMTKDYIVENYAELVGLGAKIDFNYIFNGISKEVSEYYAEKLASCESIEYDRLLSRLQSRAIFFLTNSMLLYGADPRRILKRLSPEEIEVHFGTFERYGLDKAEIQDRIDFCAKAIAGETATNYDGRIAGRVYKSLPVKHIKCLNCKNNYVYYGDANKNFCCDRCRQLHIYKREARQEIMQELEAKNAKVEK